MDPIVFALVGTAAVLHVTWNVLLKTADDPLRSATVMMTAGAVVLVPGAAVGWSLIGAPPIAADAIALGLVSGVLEAIYFGLLSAAYRRGDLSIVYPLARGSATLLAVGFGVVLLGERLGTLGQAGIAILIAGFLLLQRPWRLLRGTAGRRLEGGVAFAVATGFVVATYSAVDRVGTRLVEPWIYAAIIWTSASICLLGWAVTASARRRPATSEIALDSLAPTAVVEEPSPPSLHDWIDRRSVAGGIIGVVQYVLILAALSIAPLSAVAPLRESAVVLASGWGAFRLREAAGRRQGVTRVAAAVLILFGAVLLALNE